MQKLCDLEVHQDRFDIFKEKVKCPRFCLDRVVMPSAWAGWALQSEPLLGATAGAREARPGETPHGYILASFRDVRCPRWSTCPFIQDLKQLIDAWHAGITRDDMQAFSKLLLSKVYLEFLITGNMTEEEAVKLAKNLSDGFGLKPLPASHFPERRIVSNSNLTY